MFRLAFLLCLLFFSLQTTTAQNGAPLDYYLPNTVYDPAVPTPEDFFGWDIGKWHVSHDQLVAYMRVLAENSSRIKLTEYGRSHEERPMLCLFISSEKNLAQLDDIQAERQQFLDGKGDADQQKAVIYMGFSIHGDEPSGSNAAPLLAYYFAAAMDGALTSALENTVILFDPCFNPDGLQRYSMWVNANKSLHLQDDSNNRQQNEPWPTGRVNHYWFDLNRDWLVGQQVESKGRIQLFHQWLPNVLTDHHEMGANSTFFFQPGIPSRVNPLTPERNQELTKEIAHYHANILDKNGILYFTGERYDDFYYGKGSTFPDINGSVGILFEQAGANGTAIQTDNGSMSFPFTIRNQVFTALSSFEAVNAKRQDLNRYMQDFYRKAADEAKRSDTKALVFGGPQGNYFLDLLLLHNIEVYAYDSGDDRYGLSKDFPIYFVPMEQAKYRLLNSMLEQRTTFPDSLFYDISAWTLPLAFDLEHKKLRKNEIQKNRIGARVLSVTEGEYGIFQTKNEGKAYAWLLVWAQYEAPAFLNEVLKKGIRTKVATNGFELSGTNYPMGTIMISNGQNDFEGDLEKTLNELAQKHRVRLEAVLSGYASVGSSLGSNNFRALDAPKVMMVVGRRTSPYEAGEMWHLLDTRFAMPPTIVDEDRCASVDFSKYNVVILPRGSYGEALETKLKHFLNSGGTLISSGDACQWLAGLGLSGATFKPVPKQEKGILRPYEKMEDDRRAFALPGAIFEAKLDLTHPLCFGYRKSTLPVFLGDNLFFEQTSNAYASPVVFSENPLLAGYVHRTELPLIENAPAVLVSGYSKGRVVNLAGDSNFRGFWYGTNRLFMNAVFFGQILESGSLERK